MWHELFLIPFLSGLCLAVLLPVLGCYLRLRDEWLAALAYAHVAAAGALLSMVGGLAPELGGVAAALVAGGGKRYFAHRLQGGASYALLLLGGWSVAVLVAANQPMADRLGHALFDGQLYFAGLVQLSLVALLAVVALPLLHHLSKHLLLAHVYPDFFRVRAFRSWPIEIGFDLLAALILALATMNIGVMGGFALVFIPPWLAFRRAANWRRGVAQSVFIGSTAYVLAFILALVFDQPFGPVLALLLIAIGVVIA